MTLQDVNIVEVGPRDGLQNEQRHVPTETKVAFVEQLIAAGLNQIEVTSFVNPRLVPQLSDASEVLRRLGDHKGVTLSALVPNEKGLERALQSGVSRIAVFTAASESFCQKNINMTIDQSLQVFGTVITAARKSGLTVRGYVSTSFVCPYEGDIDKHQVLRICRTLMDHGVDEVAISDTTGAAAPTDVERTVGAVLEEVPVEHIALHLHDTYGTALANVFAGVQLGVRTFDAAAGGLGGCPFAPGASGNLATEDLVYMFERMGIRTGIDLKRLSDASRGIERVLDHRLPSKQLQRIKAAHGDLDG